MRAASPGDIFGELEPDARAGGGGTSFFSSGSTAVSPPTVDDSEFIACTRAATPADALVGTPGDEVDDAGGRGVSSWLAVEDDCMFIACIRAASPGETRGESLGFPSDENDDGGVGGGGGGGEGEGEESSRSSASRAAPFDFSESNDCCSKTGLDGGRWEISVTFSESKSLVYRRYALRSVRERGCFCHTRTSGLFFVGRQKTGAMKCRYRSLRVCPPSYRIPQQTDDCMIYHHNNNNKTVFAANRKPIHPNRLQKEPTYPSQRTEAEETASLSPRNSM